MTVEHNTPPFAILPSGHHLRRVGTQWYCHDDSGDEGGFLDFSRPLSAGRKTPTMPLREDGRRFFTPIDVATLLLVAERFDWPIVAEWDALEGVRQEQFHVSGPTGANAHAWGQS